MVKGAGAGFSKEEVSSGKYDALFAGLSVADLQAYSVVFKVMLESILVEISSGKYDELVAGMSTANLKTYSEMNDRGGSKCMMDISENVVGANAASNVQTTFNKVTLVSSGFSKETVHVEYEWKPPRCDHCKIFGHVDDQCPKNAMNIPTIDMTDDGFQVVVNKQKMNHGNSPKNGAPNMSTSTKDGLKPSSSFYSASSKKGGRKAPTNSSNMPTSNPYDLLSQEFDPENYTRSGGDPNLVQECIKQPSKKVGDRNQLQSDWKSVTRVCEPLNLINGNILMPTRNPVE
ncbi:hypothetical protein Tco_1092766 [Tanacetum coccineum]|uniref:Zinc knuckle CX2CX4HX4C n=1 Tax=Tanacetum coccineum TaxID=301880 RepID=A0ABQ5IAS1_9ASTR